MYTVYILQSLSVPKTYVGMTSDFERRFLEHNTGKSEFTSDFLPWKVIHTEICENVEDARKKEKYYKSATGRKKIAEIIKNCRIV